MGDFIELVGKLIRHKIFFRIFFHHLPRLHDRAIRPFLEISENYPGAIRLDGLLALHRNRRAHHDFHFVTERRSNHRQSDAGIPRSRFDDSFVFGQNPFRDCLLNHLERDPVFDASARISAFKLGENFRARIGAELVDFHHRSASDGFQNIFINHKLFVPLSRHEPAVRLPRNANQRF